MKRFQDGHKMTAWTPMFPDGSDGDNSLRKHTAALTALKPADRPAPAPLDTQRCFSGTGTVARSVPQSPTPSA